MLFVHDLNQRLQYLPGVASPFQVTFNLVLCHVASVYLCLFLVMHQREKFAYLNILNARNVRKPHQSNTHSVCLCMCMYIYWIFSNLYQIHVSKWMKQLLVKALYNSMIAWLNVRVKSQWNVLVQIFYLVSRPLPFETQR